MSQPHNEPRSFLPFGNPFRLILPKGSYLSPKLVSLLNTFEKTLAESLRKLKPEDATDVLSLSWLRCAVEVLSETHTNLKALITDLEFPVSDWEEKWIDVYLDDSVKLLDVCIALSSELSRLDQGQMLLQYVLHTLSSPSSLPSSEELKLAHSSLTDWVEQINSSPRVGDCCVIVDSLVRTLGSARVKNSTKGKVLMRAFYGVKVVTIFVCSVFISALVDCSKPLVALHVPNKFTWAEAFNDLQADVSEGIVSRISREKIRMLKEVEAVLSCVVRLSVTSNSFASNEINSLPRNSGTCEEVAVEMSSRKEEEASWRDSLKGFAEGAERLSLGLDLLSKQVGDFFHIVLSGRDALLCNLRVCDDVMVQVSNNSDESV